MPVSYRIDEQRDILHIVLEGAVSANEIHELRGRIRGDRRIASYMSRLIDATGLTHSFTPADIRRFGDVARLDEPPERPSRRAVVLKPAERQVMEVFQAYIRDANVQYRVFDSTREAEDWLAS